ncbi:phage/plasmid replication protein, II/X family [Acinetobacter sp. YH01009]|jgi:II/X family phage/plasmid replication protein|uniref:phage/plasmid replication protein, II/X family n=3 Tax=unclassified Acinetobacter TaxID=196816 RepID=UPI0015D43607|nr:phage/plasmid replication protein, II/X family [Acinetobacter sp. YH01009]
MIDYVSGFFPCKHDPSKLISGMVMSFDSLGNQEWVCNKKLSVEGSHSSKIQLQSHSENLVYFTGNPVKFLQGHNLFGTNDIRHLMRLFFDELLKQEALGLCPDPFQYDLIQDGHYELTRVDINESWHLNNSREVQAWIRAVGETAYLKHRGAGQFSGDTAYFGKNSRRWGLKCYSKGNEIKVKGHKLPPELCTPEMLEYADKSLRIEAFIRQLELKRRHLHILSNWDIDTPEELLLECISKLELSDVYMLKDDVLDTLPTRLRMVYQTWLNGDDLKQIMSKSAFYRCRSEMLKYGIDISTKSPKEKSNVIPLIRVLEAKPVGIPDWAYERNLVA